MSISWLSVLWTVIYKWVIVYGYAVDSIEGDWKPKRDALSIALLKKKKVEINF